MSEKKKYPIKDGDKIVALLSKIQKLLYAGTGGKKPPTK